jgi:hypothetical protein
MAIRCVATKTISQQYLNYVIRVRLVRTHAFDVFGWLKLYPESDQKPRWSQFFMHVRRNGFDDVTMLGYFLLASYVSVDLTR